MSALIPTAYELQLAGKHMMDACKARNPRLGEYAVYLHDYDIFELCAQERLRVRREVEEWCSDALAKACTLSPAVFATSADGQDYALYVGSFASDEDAALFMLRWG